MRKGKKQGRYRSPTCTVFVRVRPAFVSGFARDFSSWIGRHRVTGVKIKNGCIFRILSWRMWNKWKLNRKNNTRIRITTSLGYQEFYDNLRITINSSEAIETHNRAVSPIKRVLLAHCHVVFDVSPIPFFFFLSFFFFLFFLLEWRNAVLNGTLVINWHFLYREYNAR